MRKFLFAAVSLGAFATIGVCANFIEGARIVRQSTISDTRITESSGLGTSTRWRGFVWTHNDSGDNARVFLLDAHGKTRGVVNLGGAEAIDWEDMATSDANVYLGDIGDNERRRENITIYRFSEKLLDLFHKSQSVSFRPQFTERNGEICDVAALKDSSTALRFARNDTHFETYEKGLLKTKGNSSAIADEQTIAAQKMTLRYPDGAHDAETLIVTSRGEIVIVAKEIGAARIYKTAKPFADNTTQTLVLIGRFEFGGDNYFAQLATGGDLNAREDRVLVRTYADAYEWKLPRKNGVPDWRGVWKTAPRRFALPKTRQGEAICYNGDWWIVSSEGKNAPLQWLKPQ